jgi:lysophospholipase L1-like esterase
MRTIALVLCLLAASCSSPIPTARAPIPAAGASPYTWRMDDIAMISVNPGSYLRINFTGTSAALGVDTAALGTASTPAGQYPRVRWSIDAGAWQTAQLTSGQSSLTLGTGLAAGAHSLEVHFLAAYYAGDRWTTPVQALRVTGLTLAAGASASAPTPRAGLLIAYGDSITEGAWCDGPPTDLTTYATYQDATDSWARHVADALGCEYGIVAFGSQAWSGTGAGNVPPLPDSWDLYSAGQSRLTTGLFSPAPDYVLCNMGANGGLASAATLTTWLGDVRAAAGTDARIVIIVPFGQNGVANITSGYNAYVAANPSDNRVHLIDLGTVPGITATSGDPTFRATDGLHPDPQGHALLGAMVAARTNYGEVDDVTAQEIIDQVIAGILVTPANKLATDGAGAVTLPSIPAGWITAAGIATGAVDADAIAADAATEIAAAVASAMSATPSYSGTLATVTSSGGTFNTPVPTTSLAKHFLSLANGRTYLIDAHTASQAAFTLTEAWTTGGATPSGGDAVTTQYLSGSDFAANRTATAVAVRDVSNATPAGGSLGAAVNSAASAGDPWATLLPGPYGAGSAGLLVYNIVADTLAAFGMTDADDLPDRLDAIQDAVDAIDTGGVVAYSGTLATVTSTGGTFTVAPTMDVTGYLLDVNGHTQEIATHTAGQAAFTLQAGAWKVTPTPGDAVKITYVEGTDVTAMVAERAAVADKILGRSHAGGSDGVRPVSECLAALRNKVTWPAGTMTVYATNDSTVLWTAAVTRTSTNPVTGVDPT